MSQKKPQRFTPLFIAVSMIAGIGIGTFYANHFSGNRLNIINTGSNKINYLLHIIEEQYVDTVNTPDIVEDAMSSILSELDPHSAYIPAKEAEESVEDLRGSFSGIGVSFSIQKDTVHIMSVIKGGPSEKVGLMAGDRIVAIDGKPFVGDSVNNTEAMRRLKGPKGSQVSLEVKRPFEPQPLTFRIIRGDIPVHSVESAYMINGNTGYIKVKNFGETTYPELLVSLADLNRRGMENLILDLRGNRGGYMLTAYQMANIFLPKNRLILYTEGRKSPREEYYSDGRGSFPDLPLVVLVDEGSASSSEIVAGAIQDNDRGTIIGRRTFGKGLVQQPITFRDSSIVRLTVARYYTPSGRCIQKPYQKGHGAEYENDLLSRYEHGEFFSQDSIKLEGEVFHTNLGRTVYGGGGVMPDIFVPADTAGVTSYYREALYNGLIQQFGFWYTDDNRSKLTSFDSINGLVKYLKRQNLLNKFADFAERRGLKRRNLMLYKSRKLFETNIFSSIIYTAKGDDTYIRYLNESDPVIARAQEVFETGSAFPKAPEVPADSLNTTAPDAAQ